jgi:hypothetical protein
MDPDAEYIIGALRRKLSFYATRNKHLEVEMRMMERHDEDSRARTAAALHSQYIAETQGLIEEHDSFIRELKLKHAKIIKQLQHRVNTAENQVRLYRMRLVRERRRHGCACHETDSGDESSTTLNK